jgi:hypothetical protein
MLFYMGVASPTVGVFRAHHGKIGMKKQLSGKSE